MTEAGFEDRYSSSRTVEEDRIDFMMLKNAVSEKMKKELTHSVPSADYLDERSNHPLSPSRLAKSGHLGRALD